MNINTHKLKPTDTRGERVRATGYGRSLSLPWNYALSTEEMHAHVARLLARHVTESADADVRTIEATRTGYVFEVVK